MNTGNIDRATGRLFRRQVCPGLLMGLLILCGGVPLAAQSEPEKKRVVCSTTQIADFARQVMGELPPLMQLQIDIVATKSIFSRINL